MNISSIDSVLDASAFIHDDNRAGQVWPRLLAVVDYTLRRPFVLVPGTDSIDCSGAMLVLPCWLVWGASDVCCFVLLSAESSQC